MSGSSFEVSTSVADGLNPISHEYKVPTPKDFRRSTPTTFKLRFLNPRSEVAQHYTSSLANQDVEVTSSLMTITGSPFFLEKSLGIGNKLVMDNEKETVILQRRAIRAKNKINKGQIIKKEDIICLRPCPSDALPPYRIDEVIDKSNTVLWNGPAGYFENNSFANGTNCIAKKISENTSNKSLISIIGGGDTVSAVNKVENKLFFTHLSTAGGAFLEYLEGKTLPAIKALNQNV